MELPTRPTNDFDDPHPYDTPKCPIILQVKLHSILCILQLSVMIS